MPPVSGSAFQMRIQIQVVNFYADPSGSGSTSLIIVIFPDRRSCSHKVRVLCNGWKSSTRGTAGTV